MELLVNFFLPHAFKHAMEMSFQHFSLTLLYIFLSKNIFFVFFIFVLFCVLVDGLRYINQFPLLFIQSIFIKFCIFVILCVVSGLRWLPLVVYRARTKSFDFSCRVVNFPALVRANAEQLYYICYHFELKQLCFTTNRITEARTNGLSSVCPFFDVLPHLFINCFLNC